MERATSYGRRPLPAGLMPRITSLAADEPDD
jgi:hypothetical protein